MPDFFYSCHDCPEHGWNVRTNPKNRGEEGEYCEHHNRFFSNSFPMRDTPCKAMLEIAEHQCPECSETMLLVWSRKSHHFECPKHGVLQADGTVVPVPIKSESKSPDMPDANMSKTVGSSLKSSEVTAGGSLDNSCTHENKEGQ